MGKLLNEEINDSKKPLFLIYTNNVDLQLLFLKEFSHKLSLLFVSDNTPPNEDTESYHVKISDLNLLPHLEEKIDYALVMLTNQKDKNGMNHLIEKIKKDETKSAFIIPASAYSEFIDVLLEVKGENNIIPAIYGDILETETSQSELLKIIRMALGNEKIKLSGNDLAPVFPISRSDFITCVKQLLFSNKSNSLYYIFYKEPQTLLAAIHYLARIEPEIKFDLNHEKPVERYEERSSMDQTLHDKLNLPIHYLDSHLKGFTYAVEHLRTKPKKTYMENRPTKAKSRISLPKVGVFKFSPSVSLALFSSLLFFLFLNITAGILGVILLKGSITAFESNDFAKAREKGIMAKNILSLPLPTLNVAQSAISYIPFMDSTHKTLDLITNTADLTAVASVLIEKLDNAENGFDKKDFEKIMLDAQYLYHEGSRILLSQDNRAVMNLLKPQTTKSLSIMPILPTLLGYDSEKEYLILFINNAELRPTGGFIGSVGKLIVENGKVKEFAIQDVYDLDGQLTHHIEPHYVIRRYLQPHLYLRDSNFDLDFQRSASMSAFLYNLESKNTPDGVVAVDYNMVEKILEITGPIELPDYKKTITSEDSQEFLQDTIEKDFFPGSTQKKDVLNELFRRITLELEKKPEHLVSIGLALPQLLEQKHILLAYQNQDIQSLLSALNFGGNIPVSNAENSNTMYDTIGFNEANIGVNKVNKNVSRSISYEADLSSRLSKAQISIRNESTTDDYKTYLRLIVPRNSILRNVRIDGEEVETIDAVTDFRLYEADNFSPDPNVLEIDKVDDYFKTIFGTVITIGKGEIKTIEFEYTNPVLSISDKKDAYELHVIKQPGTQTAPVYTSILFPDDFNAAGEDINSFGSGNVKIEDNLLTDLNYEIKFSKD